MNIYKVLRKNIEKKRWQIKKNNAKRIVFLFASEKIDSLGNVSKVISDAR